MSQAQRIKDILPQTMRRIHRRKERAQRRNERRERKQWNVNTQTQD